MDLAGISCAMRCVLSFVGSLFRGITIARTLSESMAMPKGPCCLGRILPKDAELPPPLARKSTLGCWSLCMR
eukprot:4398914-Amphidinium_carterae.2